MRYHTFRFQVEVKTLVVHIAGTLVSIHSAFVLYLKVGLISSQLALAAYGIRSGRNGF